MVEFSRIHKVEMMGSDNQLQWAYISYASVNNKSAGSVNGPTKEGVQEQIDYALANPDEYVSTAMRMGYL
jgi:hypothetical protein